MDSSGGKQFEGTQGMYVHNQTIREETLPSGERLIVWYDVIGRGLDNNFMLSIATKNDKDFWSYRLVDACASEADAMIEFDHVLKHGEDA